MVLLDLNIWWSVNVKNNIVPMPKNVYMHCLAKTEVIPLSPEAVDML